VDGTCVIFCAIDRTRLHHPVPLPFIPHLEGKNTR
jgi:hypothetical protein